MPFPRRDGRQPGSQPADASAILEGEFGNSQACQVLAGRPVVQTETGSVRIQLFPACVPLAAHSRKITSRLAFQCFLESVGYSESADSCLRRCDWGGSVSVSRSIPASPMPLVSNARANAVRCPRIARSFLGASFRFAGATDSVDLAESGSRNHTSIRIASGDQHEDPTL